MIRGLDARYHTARHALRGCVWVLVAIFVGSPCTSFAQAVPSPTTLAQQINAYIDQPQFTRADWGIALRSLDSGQTLYAHNATRLFVPASTAKLFTAGLALADLGSATRIATTLYATSTRISANGTLRGDLILYGRGDPSLGLAATTPDWADHMAVALKQRGIKRIVGNLIADATYFAGSRIGAGWEANDLQTWYGAPASALNVDGNLMHVTVARDGRRCCDVSVTPDAAGIAISNQTSADATQPLSLYRPPGSATLFALGQLPARAQRHTYALSLPDPERAAAETLRQALARTGITLAGKIVVLRWPESDPAVSRPGTQALASVESPTIAELVAHTLKDSDNLFAQALWLQVGTNAAQRRTCIASPTPTTSADWALCALHAILQRAGIAADAVLLAEGSGLARQNLVTPDALVAWLAWTATQPWGADFRAALPVAGVDGTLATRFRTGPATDNLRAKTGTLSHDYTLAGFVTDAAGEHLAFAIMLNRYPRWEVARSDPAVPAPKHLLDAVAKLIAVYAGKS
ncbi:MAG TPA: D-alanyl-D-alanine carboxypeptidase/D-alanyl-D-alanine-endopeptidase [Rhodanobacteraceae bacterium]